MFSRLRDRIYYGWVVLISFLIVCTLIFGIRFSFGVFFKAIESEFNLTRAVTSSVMSTQMLLGCIFAFLAGWAIDKYGPRIVILVTGISTGLGLLLTSQVNSAWQLFMTQGLLLSLGTGTIYVVTIATISRWFAKKRGLALGIAMSGAGVGPMVIAPLASYLITNSDWRMAYIIIAVIGLLIVVPISMLLKKDPTEIGAAPDGVKPDSHDTTSEKDIINPTGLSIAQAFGTRSFWLIAFIWVFFAYTIFLVLTHIVPHATDIGFTAAEAAGALSIIGGTSVASMILMGIVSDRIDKKTPAAVCALLMAGTVVSLLWLDDLWALYLFAAVYGFGFGGQAPSISALLGDVFGLRKIGSIVGVLSVGWGIGAAVGPLVGGLVFDVTNSYSIAFIIGAAGMSITSLLIALIRQETGRGLRS